ncbi:MAG: DUF2809 domain-containing protein [Lachnospiraceae bacterium]|nr:DUF2809 domain-containing protein [Lachnospiraceae bacterium]
MRKRRLIFGIITAALLITEVLIGMYAGGWIRSYLGDVLVVILLYTLFRTIIPDKPEKWYILPTVILIFAFIVEFLQLWGFCDRFGITNRFLRMPGIPSIRKFGKRWRPILQNTARSRRGALSVRCCLSWLYRVFLCLS